MKSIFSLLSLMILFAAQNSSAAEPSIEQVQSQLDAHVAQISLLQLNSKSATGIEIKSLSEEKNLDHAKCTDTALGITLCTISLLDGCGHEAGLVSMTLSSEDKAGLVQTSEIYPFPTLIAKPERVGMTLIGCEDGPPRPNHPGIQN